MPTTTSSKDPSPRQVVAERERLRAAKALIKNAKTIVAAVDASDFCRLHTEPRSFPIFESNEIVTGPLLGVGGFGIVFEVKEIRLDGHKAVLSAGKAAGEEGTSQTSEQVDDMEGQEGDHRHQENEKHERKLENHYDIEEARSLMVANVRRGTDARYAIKKLHPDLSYLEHARGMIDLAIETKFLSRLWHPNIIKMRGYSAGPMLDGHSFIVLDRLYETLDQKIIEWRNDSKELHSVVKKAGALKSMFSSGSSAVKKHRQEAEHDLLLKRMLVAYDLASAFTYMHQNKLVYRDIKQENFGFDVRGDVKVFDFGLAKGLSESLRAKCKRTGRLLNGYDLTVRTGSVPYMAPEVADKKPYDCKCDVFSFAVLLFEILALQTAFKGYTKLEYLRRVVHHKERLKIPRHVPPLTRLMISEAWAHEPTKRPEMKRVAAMLRGDLNDLSSDATVQDRTMHMRDRSSHSQRLQRIEFLHQKQRDRRPSHRELEF